MKKILTAILGVVMTPFYFGAYAVSNILCLKGREDMESPKKWINLILGETEEE